MTNRYAVVSEIAMSYLPSFVQKAWYLIPNLRNNMGEQDRHLRQLIKKGTPQYGAPFI